MDQNSTDGTDKRNWRERLGIGGKEGMPRIAAEFKEPARVSAGSARPGAATVKPAPMAPRLAPRPAGAAAPADRPPSPAQDALANKLKAQRDAAEKLAEQRVSSARQRAESASAGPSKPKFSFADPDSPKPQQAARPAPAQQPPKFPAQTPPAPQLQPPRQQLGQGAGFKPVPPAAPASYAQQPPSRGAAVPPQSPYQRQYTQPPYPPQTGYRPIDPSTGYTAPSAYVPPQQRSGYVPPSYQPTPSTRPSVPARGQAPAYPPVQGDLRPTPRLGPGANLRTPPEMGFEDDQDDIFEQPAPAPVVGRRATANDYQQAYRDAEPAYEDDLPRSRLPLILMILLVLALASGIGGIWAYNNLIKGASAPVAGDASAPVVAAPAQPAKVSPDAAAGTKTEATPPAGSNKKQIYDRIIGDHEVLSGQMKTNEEAPVQPDANAAPPAPGDNPNAGTGDNGMPLPLPPPPGSSGGTQGTLEQNKDTNVAQIAPAAEPSSAALSTGGQPAAVAPAPAEPPVPSSQPSKVATTNDAANTITDQPDPVPAPAAKPIDAKTAEAKKLAAAKPDKSLGAKPVVLVPPAKVASADPVVTPISQPPGNAQNSLYNGPAVGTDAQAANPAVTPPAAAAPAAPAKRKTLSDLFKSSTPATTPSQAVATTTPVAPAAPAPSTAPVAGGFVAQLASFKTRAEASDEYARLAKKHGAIISKYAPIIETAEVAGSPRFRLNIGPMPTMEVATNLCSALFSAGERDCVVHRQ